MKAEAHRGMTAAELCEALDNYISSKRHCSDVDERWLAAHIEATLLNDARQVRNNRLQPELKEKVNAFRAEEIRKSLTDKRRETEVLERDLAALTRKAG